MNIEEREKIVPMLQDGRKVRAIWLSEGVSYKVGRDCDDIHTYGEPGQQAFQPWFAIKKGGTVIARVNASQVAVVAYYED